MMQNPYESPQTDSAGRAKNVEKIRESLGKLVQARKGMLVVLPIIAIITTLQHFEVMATGFLPNWIGVVLIVMCIIQIPILSYRINKLERLINA